MLKRPFNPTGKACLSLSLCERWAGQLSTGCFQSHTMNNPEVIAEWYRRQNKARKQSIAPFFELKKSVSGIEKSASSTFEEERNRWYWVRCPQGSAKLKTTQTKLSQTALQSGRRRQARWKERKRMGLKRKKSYVGSVLACLSVSV